MLLVVLVPAAVSAYFLGVDPFWCAALLLVALWLLPKLYKEGVQHYLTRTAMKNRAAASPHMRRATDFFIKEDYDQAILEYSMAISIDRYSVSKYNLRGGLFSLQKQYDYAIVDYTSAINIAPKLRGLGSPISDNLMDTWASAYDGRGKAHFAKEEFDLAIDDLSNSIFYLHVLATVNLIDDDVSFSLSRAFDYRGRSYLAIGDYDSAVADFESSLRFELHDSDDSIVRYTDANRIARRADQHYECEEYDSAITGYTLAIHIDPDFAGDYNKRGLAYLAKYEYDSAIADFETAISISPHFDEMIYENRDKAHRSKENSGSGK